MSPRVLVTGASGMLGSALVRAWRRDREVVGAAGQTRIPGIVDWCGDLSVPGAVESVFEASRPGLVVHTAAWTDVDGCEQDPGRASRENVDMTRRLADRSRRHGAGFVYISTEAVFDGQRGGYLEEDLPNPVNEYARSKLAGEVAAQDAHPGTLVLRVGLEGWRVAGRPGFVQWVIEGLRAREHRNIVTDWVHTPLFAGNAASIIDDLVKDQATGVFHVGTRTPASNWDAAVSAARCFGLDATLLTPISGAALKLRAQRPRDTSMNTDKVRRRLGRAAWDLETALVRMRDDEGEVAALRRQLAS